MDRALGRAGYPPDEHLTERIVRRNAVFGAVIPGLVVAYLLLTWSQPHRPVMLALTLALVAQCALTYVTARQHARHEHRLVLDALVISAHLAVASALALLDGGIGSPLGLLVLTLLPVLSITVVPAFLVGGAVAVMAVVAAIAVAAPASPPGYEVVYTFAFLVIAGVCGLHSHALSSLRRRLVDVCRMDPLTHCLNRAGFEARLMQEVARASRAGETLVLALFDLDRFKDVNDTYGHSAGDQLLAWTAQTLQQGVRGQDVVGRVGGDEFAAVLTGLLPEDAPAAVRRLQDQLGDRSPASVGYAIFPSDGSDLVALRQLADRRLYEDKSRRGRPGPRASSNAAAARRNDVPEPRQNIKRHERRRKAVEETGRLISANFGIGVLYLVVFSTSPHRAGMLVMCAGGVALGLLLSASAPRMAAARSASRLMTTVAMLGVPLVAALVVVDGGVSSPLSVGVLTPMPLVALTTPPRRATVIGSTMVLTYVGIALVVGGTTTWTVVSHVVIFLLISAACAAQARVAALQRQRLFTLSRSDLLTECLNRRGFEEQAARAFARAARGGERPTLVLLDLDNFKQVNDRRGHAAGDELLQWVAASLRGALRVEDTVARLGGDEFAVLLAGSHTRDALTVGPRLRAGLEKRTSVSIGVATLVDDGLDLEALYRHADAMLYAEKATKVSSRRRSHRRSAHSEQHRRH